MWILIGKRIKYVPKYSIARTLITKPRVRFAPSPTGYLHLGGLRTALYNFLFAKSQNGDFVLRIEDTDQTRKVEGAVETLVKDLQWAGISLDEGPVNEGPFGPYLQSERVNIYQEHVKTLLNNGSAYYCFCSTRRLKMLRTDAENNHLVFQYDNKCRNLTSDQIEQKFKLGLPYCIRFKLSADTQSFEDMICGNKEIPLSEGDPVVMKADGYPTYHFANVVDDHLMQITHVLRGAEWITSTPKHLMLYRAFGWSPPKYGHLPLMKSVGGAKLSKRQGDVRIDVYRKKGDFPLALMNYLNLPTSEIDNLRRGAYRIRTMDELIKEFKVDNVCRHIDYIDQELIRQLNKLEHRRNLDDDKISTTVNKVQRLLKQTYPNENLSISDEYVKKALQLTTTWVTKVDDLLAKDFAFLWILPTNPKLEVEKDILEKVTKSLEQLEKFDQEAIHKATKRFATENKVKFPVLMNTLRSMLSGTKDGPRVKEMMELLGKQQSLERIKTALK